MTPHLFKRISVYIAVSLLSQAMTFFLWVILAWRLSPAQVGMYALSMLIVDFLGAVSMIGLNAAAARFYYWKEEVTAVFSNLIFLLFLSSVVTVLLFLSLVSIIPLLLPGASQVLRSNLAVFSLIIFVNSFSNFSLAHYAALKKTFLFAKLQLLNSASFFVFAVIFVYQGMGISGIFYALLLSYLITIFLFILKEYSSFSPASLSPRIIKPVASYSLPLMFYTSLSVIIMYFSRIVLDRYASLTTLGVYSFFLMIALQADGAWGSFNRAWTPEIFAQLKKDKEKTKEQINSMMFFLIFLYLAGLGALIAVGELFLFKLLLAEPYFSQRYILYILLSSPLFVGIYTVAYPLFYYHNNTKRILFVSLLIDVLSIIYTFAGIRFFGEVGAAISFFLTSITNAVLYLFVFRKIIHTMMPKIFSWTLFLGLFISLGIFAFLKMSSYLALFFFVSVAIVLNYDKRYLQNARILLKMATGDKRILNS